MVTLESIRKTMDEIDKQFPSPVVAIRVTVSMFSELWKRRAVSTDELEGPCLKDPSEYMCSFRGLPIIADLEEAHPIGYEKVYAKKS